MIGTPTLTDSASLLGSPAGELVLRVVRSDHSASELRLSAAKCTLGSSSRCTLRLVEPHVKPVHCVILRGARCTIMRSWSPDTRLNGRAVHDALLAPGDRLACGPVEMLVVDTAAGSDDTQADSPAGMLHREDPDMADRNRLSDRLDQRERALAVARSRSRLLVESLRNDRQRIQSLEGDLKKRQEEARRSAERLERWQAEREEERIQLTERAAELRDSLLKAERSRRQMQQFWEEAQAELSRYLKNRHGARQNAEALADGSADQTSDRTGRRQTRPVQQPSGHQPRDVDCPTVDVEYYAAGKLAVAAVGMTTCASVLANEWLSHGRLRPLPLALAVLAFTVAFVWGCSGRAMLESAWRRVVRSFRPPSDAPHGSTGERPLDRS